MMIMMSKTDIPTTLTGNIYRDTRTDSPSININVYK